jgi:hypothetical protein
MADTTGQTIDLQPANAGVIFNKATLVQSPWFWLFVGAGATIGLYFLFENHKRKSRAPLM